MNPGGQHQAFEMHAKDAVFWGRMAQQLQRAAGFSWAGYEAARRPSGAGRYPALGHAAEAKQTDAELELNQAYAYLTGLAIEYLCIGILVGRDPERFLHELPAHRILQLVSACGITPSARQSRIIHGIESSLQWGTRNPVTLQARDQEHHRALARLSTQPAMISADDKAELDALYARLGKALGAEMPPAGKKTLDAKPRGY